MALQTELLSLLENSDEPLSKRLRIATDVFNTSELPVFNKENVLFNWFSKTCLKTDSSDVWDTLHECIISPYMKDISTNEIKHNVLNNIVKALVKQLQKETDNNFKNNVIKCGIAIFNNEVFQQYFKHDLEQYSKLLSSILVNVEDINVVREVIAINLLFSDNNFDKMEYVSNFLLITLDALINVLLKFKDDNLCKDVQKLINRAIFSLNRNDFINFLQKAYEQSENLDESSSNIIFDKLRNLYKYNVSQTAKLSFKLIFFASLSVCNTEISRYQLFVFILHIIGFKVEKIMKLNLPKNDENFDLEKSLEILAEILEVMHNKNIVIKEKINEITFSDFLKSLILSIIRLQAQPSTSTLKILTCIIDIDPLIIENSVNEILAFITFSQKDKNLQIIYSEFMISTMKMFFKLRRVGKFYSILLETIQKKVNLNFKSSKPEIKFSAKTNSCSTSDNVCDVKDVLPNNVLQCFQECITLQSALEVTKIVRTCVYHLKQITDDFQSYADDKKVFFVQIVSEIICNLLCAVKLADNSATEHSVNRFVDDMNSLREELKKFGTALLTVEHNHLLMFSFLNICYTWAEVAMLITFYTSAKSLNFRDEKEKDTSVNNLSYLHNYLSPEQWSLVLQRIKNFGEQPCKHILQKLLIQKLRAMLIFEEDVNETIESSIVSSYATNLETCWDILLSERFIAASFIPKMDASQLITLAELLIDHMITTNNVEILKQRTIIDSRDLMTSVFYICLSKINDLFKRKRKHSDSTNIKPISTKIFKHINKNNFIKSEVVDVETLTGSFTDTFNEILDFNEESFCTYMEIIKCIPVTSLHHNIQVTLFLYLLSICSDLKSCRKKYVECLNKCEEYLIALVEDRELAPNMFCYMKSDNLVKYIIESVERYTLLLSIIIGKGLTQNDSISSYKSVIHLLEKNITDDRYLETIFVTLRVINNVSLKNVSDENKAILQKYKEKICKKLLKLVITNESISDNIIVAYTVSLENYLSNDTEDNLIKLIPLLKQNIDYALSNINENNFEKILPFFKLILTKKSSFKDVPVDFHMSSWRACNDLKNIDKYKHFNQITKLLFEDSDADIFSTFLQEFLEANLYYLKHNQTEKIIKQLKMWKILMSSELTIKKNNIVTNMTQTLFANLAVFLTNNNLDQKFNSEFVEFQICIIENQKEVLTPTIMDVHFQTIQILIFKEHTDDEFITAFETSFPILESLANFRKELLIDRLPTFLLHFRLFLHHLCLKSNSDKILSDAEFVKITNCAFRIEKLTRIICMMKKDIFRITPYLIADFLKEYEKIALYPDVKHHLNNCLMELIALCDNHAVSYLLRVLSPASTELFKEGHYNFNKYYKFTGKI